VSAEGAALFVWRNPRLSAGASRLVRRFRAFTALTGGASTYRRFAPVKPPN